MEQKQHFQDQFRNTTTTTTIDIRGKLPTTKVVGFRLPCGGD